MVSLHVSFSIHILDRREKKAKQSSKESEKSEIFSETQKNNPCPCYNVDQLDGGDQSNHAAN